MNSAQREIYEQKNRRRMQLFERMFLRSMTFTIHGEMKRAARALRGGKISAYLATSTLIADLSPKLADIYNVVGVFYARKTLRDVRKSAKEEKAFGLDQEFIDRIIEYFKNNLLNKAVIPISETTRRDIMAILTKGEQEGWGIDRMAFELERADLSLFRARRILRTEVLKAQNAGKNIGAEESEFETVKQWIAAKDERTRKSHRTVDGQYVDVTGRFAVPRRRGGYDMMTGPGDPDASAENVIQCRCTSVVVAKRDENGRLIRKRKISVLLPSDIKPFTRVVTI